MAQFRRLSAAYFSHDFATILAPSFGCGSCGTGSPGCQDRRTEPSCPCGPRCGPRRWPWSGGRALRRSGRTAPEGAGCRGADPMRPSGTSSARTAPPHCDRWCAWAGERRSIHPAPGRSTLDAGRAGAAYWPWAITSRQNKKRPSLPHPLGMLRGSGAGPFGRWLRRVDVHDGFLPA